MPSEILQAEIIITKTTVEMVFDQLLGDEVIEAADGDLFDERVIGHPLLRA